MTDWIADLAREGCPQCGSKTNQVPTNPEMWQVPFLKPCPTCTRTEAKIREALRKEKLLDG